jgi:hypothetical protein
VIIENPNRDVNVVIHEDSMEQDMIFKMSVWCFHKSCGHPCG